MSNENHFKTNRKVIAVLCVRIFDCDRNNGMQEAVVEYSLISFVSISSSLRSFFRSVLFFIDTLAITEPKFSSCLQFYTCTIKIWSNSKHFRLNYFPDIPDVFHRIFRIIHCKYTITYSR